MASRPGRTTLQALQMWLNTRRSTDQISSSGTLKSMTRSARCVPLTVQAQRLQSSGELEERHVFPDGSMGIVDCRDCEGHTIGDLLHCTQTHDGHDVCAIEHKVTPCLLQVEPFQRSLKDMAVDVMINGRRRDHGFERAQLEVRHCRDTLLGAA